MLILTRRSFLTRCAGAVAAIFGARGSEQAFPVIEQTGMLEAWAEPPLEELTLGEWAKRMAPDGRVDEIVEMLNQTNEILDDLTWRSS